MSNKLKVAAVTFANAVDELIFRYTNQRKKQARLNKFASQKIASVTNLLVEKGVISPGASDIVREELQDPYKALILLEKVAERVRPGSFGAVVGSPIKSNRTYFIGQYIPEDERESGQEFKRAFLR